LAIAAPACADNTRPDTAERRRRRWLVTDKQAPAAMRKINAPATRDRRLGRKHLGCTEGATNLTAGLGGGGVRAVRAGTAPGRGSAESRSPSTLPAGERVNAHEIRVCTRKGYTRRIMDAMGHGELQQEITRLADSAAVPERRRAVDLTHRRDWLRERVRDYVEHQFLLHADVTGRRLREDMLRDVRLSALEQRHHRMLHDLVLRMARRLVSEHSRRRKVFRRGSLHVPRTLRRNMKYDDAVFDLQWKSVKVDRPKVFAVCDVSGSVAAYARFMLMFIQPGGSPAEGALVAFSSDLGESPSCSRATRSTTGRYRTQAIRWRLHRLRQAFADFAALVPG
jgi:hypothetical protein